MVKILSSLTCHTCKLVKMIVAIRLLPTMESLHAFSDHDICEAFSFNKIIFLFYFFLILRRFMTKGQLLLVHFLMLGRSFQVCCDTTTLSCHLDMVEGMPQGSFLTILLFQVGFIGVISSVSPSVMTWRYVRQEPNFPAWKELQLAVNLWCDSPFYLLHI